MEKNTKNIFICGFIALLSLIAFFAIIIITVNIENWNDNISTTLKILSQVSWGCFFISIFGIAVFRQKNKDHKTEDKIKELEQEIERLKNK